MKMSFFSTEESELIEKFLRDGFVIVPLETSRNSTLSDLRKDIFKSCKDYLKLSETLSEEEFFNHTEEYLEVNQLNDLKLKLISLVGKDFKYHEGIYRLGQKFIDAIVGNELCMQRGLNLSIQLPHDDSALLPLHTDVWSGNSPYEIVFWLPLVNCYKTKSMYVLPLQKSREVYDNFHKYESMDAESFYKSLEQEMVFLDVPKGHAVIFSHSIIHGNRINVEPETRWTFNIRFKSLLTPLGTKDMGETFIPVTIRPVTRIGYSNKLPTISR